MSYNNSSNKRLQLVVLGAGGIGKTALVIRYFQNHFVEEYDPTIEDSYRKQCMVDGSQYMLDILDTAGQDDYSAMRDQYIRNGSGFLIIYDICCRSSFEKCPEFFEQIQRVKELDSFPFVLIGNKVDLESQRQVSTVEGNELAKYYNVPFFETSAKNKTNVEECFSELVRCIKRHNQQSKRDEKNKNSDNNENNNGNNKDKKQKLSLKKKLFYSIFCGSNPTD
ncbi:hypothetical protein DICPUDRAFT_168758 [Dictyostelium purpureum]|uniref:small monomeric GTPase n=1 Tax=Dictyostelium purpureum TaxID=5786 RepID=F0ZKQ6_DICPU|nr:uncharacterized protein DICPUDRAFT_168758 [Dictyostelium purpureum]EGC35471.1 hypothetical protein DICPUDRAFT_168758 [Dictyostelium purpureum]|eukprot:XP_003288014.1 hypothetical protein DICPUDRAFT_168758 [Dictyostelium purpureum]